MLVQQVYAKAMEMDLHMIIEAQKAIVRHKPTAARCHLQFVLRCLIPLMNISYRPTKGDFGFRYPERGYPADQAKWARELLYNRGFEAVIRNLDSAFAHHWQNKATLAYLVE